MIEEEEEKRPFTPILKVRKTINKFKFAIFFKSVQIMTLKNYLFWLKLKTIQFFFFKK